MFEKVNPSHPDKIADRIAGAIVDLAYKIEKEPKIAVEVLIGHKECNIIIETSCYFDTALITKIVKRITKDKGMKINLTIVKQDKSLADNQKEKIRCGDNGIFKGVPITQEERKLTEIAKELYKDYPFDGKFIINNEKLVICQSNVDSTYLCNTYPNAIVNPLGEWLGGLDVDSGVTNRKLGSDMGEAVTGGGLHGKDLSKADVSLNIYCHLKAQELGRVYTLSCAIGDEKVDGLEYNEIVEIARKYILDLGGFEKFAEWGLIR